MLGLSATQPGFAMTWADWLWLGGGLVVTCGVLGAVLFWLIQESRAGVPPERSAPHPPEPPRDGAD